MGDPINGLVLRTLRQEGGKKMRQVCCVCKILYGLKEPLDNDEETHGYCPECYGWQMANIERELGKAKKVDPEDGIE